MPDIFDRPENTFSAELIALDADQQALVVKGCAEVRGALSFVAELAAKGELTVSIRHNAFGLARIELNRLGTILGAQADVDQEHAGRLAHLRQANATIHELRAELGKGVTAAAIASALYRMTMTIYDFWKSMGFLHSTQAVHAWSFGAHVACKLSCHIDRYGSTNSDRPVTDKAAAEARVAALADELELFTPRGDDPCVLDIPANRAKIAARLRSRFPGTRVSSWESMAVYSQYDSDDRCRLTKALAHVPLTSIEPEPGETQ